MCMHARARLATTRVALICLDHRTRCVYELATFTRMHRMHEPNAPRGRLLLLSLSWPSSLSPFKQAKPSTEELDWIRNFSCANARCFKPGECVRCPMWQPHEDAAPRFALTLSVLGTVACSQPRVRAQLHP